MGNNKGEAVYPDLAASFLGSGVTMGDGTDALNASLIMLILFLLLPFCWNFLDMKVPCHKKVRKSLWSTYLDEESSPWWGYVIGFPGMVIGGVKSLFTG